MSLLEDVFLEDEADEAQELERVIEGDEYDDHQRAVSPNSDGNSVKDDEAEEAKRVDPNQGKARRVVKNPRVTLNPARLTGPRGIQVIPEHFKDFKFKGKGHEKEDLDLVLKKLEHWAYRLYPKFEFEDCLKKIETLGKKRPVMVHLHKIRSDQFASEETVVQRDSSDDEMPVQEEDEFDKLLEQQIALARSTPAPNSVKKVPETPTDTVIFQAKQSIPKGISSPSINDEQRERMLRNRQLAEERRLARFKQISTEQNNITNIEKQINSMNKDVEENVESNTLELTVHNDKVIDKQSSNNDFDNLRENTNIINDDIRDSTDTGNTERCTEINEENLQDKTTNKDIEVRQDSELNTNSMELTTDVQRTLEVSHNNKNVESSNLNLIEQRNGNEDAVKGSVDNDETSEVNIVDVNKEIEVFNPKDNEMKEVQQNKDEMNADKSNAQNVTLADDLVMDVDFGDDF